MIPVLDKKYAVSEDVKKFLSELESISNFEGEIGLDDAERLVHSTDNSIYQVLPHAVIYPKSTNDVSQIMTLMAQDKYDSVRVSPRGAGTGTNGQALSESIIIDTSKYMTSISEINTEKGYAVVEPGVVLDQLNKELGKKGYFFAPMVSTSSRATLGGMCANDSSGIGSLIYGKTSNHLLEVEMVLSDGSIYNSTSLSKPELESVKSENNLASSIISTVEEVVTTKRSKVVEVFPKLNRFMTGYNLFHALEENGNVNLNYIVSGSEGTLSLFTKMKVKIIPKPSFEKVVVCKFKSFEAGLRSASYIVEHMPTGIETIDGNIVSLAREDNIWAGVSQFFSEPGDEDVECVNYVQFTGHSEGEVNRKVEGLVRELENRKGKPRELNSYLVAENKADLTALWSMRKKGVGLLGNKPGERRPQAFVEDTAVAPEVLADFIM
jgi:FAD/FMN-containing dehydrogenase